ncbi:hypothetical protein NDU88_004829 [Pleurodeles waltl]|uniref:Uncharacterized protein n=1 Tax=Pleurodeles waltl TaxID=8319 RepID=A0AAV7WT40_PLEWA|nr:hypothetical protein NDU88_004829 [Pleurodeles waltl]
MVLGAKTPPLFPAAGCGDITSRGKHRSSSSSGSGRALAAALPTKAAGRPAAAALASGACQRFHCGFFK